jgi:glucose/arabinose dehydrogenase
MVLGVLTLVLFAVDHLRHQLPVKAIANKLGVEEYALNLPPGFRINLFADELPGVRFMTVGPDGDVYASLMQQGKVVRLRDSDHDGAADVVTTIAEQLRHPHGLAFFQGRLYVAEETAVSELIDTDGDLFIDQRVPLIELPPGPESFHFTRTIAFGPDGRLYVSIGATCDACLQPEERRASVLDYDAAGGDHRVFARGLRNAVGFVFHPTTGELWATNNERDQLGDNFPADTLNLVGAGSDFGFPRCINGNTPDFRFGDNNACHGVAPPAIEFQAHSAPLGLAFYTGTQFPEEYHQDLIVAFHGSWNRSSPTGYKLVRVRFDRGRPTGETIDFATGWLDGKTVWGRPVDIVVGLDGSLFASDDLRGRIYRISFKAESDSPWWPFN